MIQKYTDFVLDLETLSLRPNAVIFDIAIVAFDFKGVAPNLAWTVKPAPVFAGGRAYHIDNKTLAFHDKLKTGQGLAFLHACLTVPEEIEGCARDLDVAQGIKTFIRVHRVNQNARIWAQGKDFDFPILVNYYRTQFGTNPDGVTDIPWEYRQQRCARDFKDNALDTYGEPLRVKLEALKATRLPPHNALNDCLNTIEVLRTCAGFMPDFK